MCLAKTCPICEYYKALGKEPPTMKDLLIRNSMFSKKKKKHRSIDDDWEDSNKPTFTPCEIPANRREYPSFLDDLRPKGEPIVVKILGQPKEKFYYNVLVHKLGEAASSGTMCIGPEMHKKIMQALGQKDEQTEQAGES